MARLVAEAEGAAHRWLSLRPGEFDRLCPAELDALLEGAQWRDARQAERLAWAVAHLKNVSGNLKRAVRHQDLLVELIGRTAMRRRLLQARAAGRSRPESP